MQATPPLSLLTQARVPGSVLYCERAHANAENNQRKSAYQQEQLLSPSEGNLKRVLVWEGLHLAD